MPPPKKQTTVAISVTVSGLTVTVGVAVKLKPRATVRLWEVSWGDGTVANGAGNPPNSLSHTYPPISKDYNIRCAIQDSTGFAAEDTKVGMIRYTPPSPPGGGGGGGGGDGLSFLLDDFSTNRVTNPELIGVLKPLQSHLWGLYTDYEETPPNTYSPTTVGTSSPVWSGATDRLKNTFNQTTEFTSAEWEANPFYAGHPPNWQFQCRPYLENGNYTAPKHAAWNWIKTYVTNYDNWINGRVDRLKFRFRVPSSITFSGSGGTSNFQFGTFVKHTAADNAAQEGGHPELGDGSTTYNGAGWHWYHNCDFDYRNGVWWSVVFDTHPQEQRQCPPGVDQGDKRYIDSSLTGTSYTYYDLLTYFYLDFPYLYSLGDGNDFYIAKMEMFEETNNEDCDNISNMHGFYDSTDNTTYAAWNRYMGAAWESTGFQIRYAWSKMSTFSSGITPSTSTVMPPAGSGPYTICKWSVTDIDWTGHTSIWIAVKYDDGVETRFHQFEIIP